MSPGRALLATRLIRQTDRRGFCPACRLWVGDAAGRVHKEIAPPALIALAFLAVAGAAWWLVVRGSNSMSGVAMEPRTLGPFAAGWAVMMAATMLPSAIPLVFEFAERSERRMRWRVATGLLGATYLAVWLAFGLACYLLLSAVPAAGPEPRLAGGLALVLAGLYSLTPIKRASEARCRGRSALQGPLPFDLMRSAVVVGVRYGVRCVGCSAGLMVAMLIIGMSNLAWVVVLSAVVLFDKLAPPGGSRRVWLLATAIAGLGILYGLL